MFGWLYESMFGVWIREKPAVCPADPFTKLVLMIAWPGPGPMLMGFTYLMNIISERRHTIQIVSLGRGFILSDGIWWSEVHKNHSNEAKCQRQDNQINFTFIWAEFSLMALVWGACDAVVWVHHKCYLHFIACSEWWGRRLGQSNGR